MAAPTPGVAEHVSQAVLKSASTLNARMMMAMARGDLAGAVSMWELEMGREAPKWLQAFQAAFSTANQKAGPCTQVAQAVFDGFKRLGANPSYIRFSTTGSGRFDGYISFERRAGEPQSAVQISINFYHFAVQVGDRVYDAMTGPMGLTVAEYTSRLYSPAGSVLMQTASQLP